jgi:hypothetical protein
MENMYYGSDHFHCLDLRSSQASCSCSEGGVDTVILVEYLFLCARTYFPACFCRVTSKNPRSLYDRQRSTDP